MPSQKNKKIFQRNKMATLDFPIEDVDEALYITCTYFKESGKFYTQGTARYELDDPMFHDPRFHLSILDACIYPKQYGIALKSNGRLPGLDSNAGGTWDWHFTVVVNNTKNPRDGGYPELVGPND
jgi:hypothetical protein